MYLRMFTAAGLTVTSLGLMAALAWAPPEAPDLGPYIELPEADSFEPPPKEPLITETTHRIAAGDTLGALLRRYGAPLDAVLAAAAPYFDLTRLAMGRELLFVYLEEDPVPVNIRYPLDEDHTLVLSREGELWTGEVSAIHYEARPAVREIVVETSLWAAAIDGGLRPADIAALAAVFEYDVDFNTEVQRGARARIAVDELWADGDVVKLGSPYAVRFENGGKTYTAIRFTREDGTTGYFDEDGMSRKKAFLRSPLAFSRVTSGFNLKRFHPVLKKARPHYGTDFGAPTGTPVRAVGDGVVEQAGPAGGHGNFVKLDHDGPYESSYSHLSKIYVKAGQKVQQGQIVGLVGSTGLATGPHLHFQFWVNGKYVNPMSVELPRNEPLPESELAAFKSTRERWLSFLDGGAGADSAALADGEEL